ncbi:MAG TPA: hypothetical protein VHX16_10830, partial [Chloroflexota bacterium]|nr:hypothetical protein [Chloroflexota bacterium]
MDHESVGAVLLVPTGPIACDGCRAIVEARLRANPHVLGVTIDARERLAHVQVDDSRVRTAELAELVAQAYGERSPVPLPGPEVSSHEHAHTEHAGMAYGAHDMSDPAMAATMEADMRRRFWISLVL